MKVLQLGKFYPPDTGGIEQVMFDITEGLNERSIHTDVLCSNNINEYTEDKIKDYTVYRTKSLGQLSRTSLSIQMITKLCKIINNYDIVHVHHPDPMAALALFFAHPKCKVVVHWHSDIIKQRYLLKLYAPLQNWLLHRANKIIGTTPKYITESQTLQKFKNKCIAIPIGIDKTRLKAKLELATTIKNKYGDKKIIFSIGRLIYYKGFEYLILSAKFLSDDYVILIAGDGPLKSKLTKLIQKEGLGGKVYLLDRIKNSELGSYYSACDIFCLPSVAKSEAFGIVQIEAMSFGKPIVATKIEGSGVDWVNDSGVSGLNVKTKDPKELAQAITDIINNIKRYERYSKAAKERFCTLFTRDKMISDIIKLY